MRSQLFKRNGDMVTFRDPPYLSQLLNPNTNPNTNLNQNQKNQKPLSIFNYYAPESTELLSSGKVCVCVFGGCLGCPRRFGIRGGGDMVTVTFYLIRIHFVDKKCLLMW